MNPENTASETTEIAEVEDPMAEGVLVGGWPFIWSAYLMTWGFLLAYAIYVNVRRAMAARRLASNEAGPR